MREQSRTITPTERKFWTGVKTYFTTLEEDETPCFEDKVIMWVMGIVITWVVLLVAMAS